MYESLCGTTCEHLDALARAPPRPMNRGRGRGEGGYPNAGVFSFIVSALNNKTIWKLREESTESVYVDSSDKFSFRYLIEQHTRPTV